MSEQAEAAMESAECKHCHRRIVNDPTDGWVDPEAPLDTDDSIWRETCDRHDTFIADHEPLETTHTITVELEVTTWASPQDVQEALRARLSEFYPVDGAAVVPNVQSVTVEPAALEVIVMQVETGPDEEEIQVPWSWVDLFGKQHDEISYYRVRDFVVVCPHPGCTSESFYEVDRAERWNRMHLLDEGRTEEPVLVTHEGSNGDGYATHHFMCEDDDCRRDVLMPQWLTTEWS